MNNNPDNHHREVWAVTRATLDKMAREDKKAVSSACLNWLWDNEAGQPAVDLTEENARANALFWAETASPVELECYMLAACMKLEGGKSMFHRRHIKRLIASLWKRMWPEDQAGFMIWAEKNRNEKEQ